MNTKKRLYVANWKMNMPLQASRNFIQDHLPALTLLADKKNTTIVICPSFIALANVHAQTRTTSLKIGAQNCSHHASGAYTGEVDACSLAQLGCTYTLVGHSECRHYFNESNEIIGQKVARLLENKIIPIACIGETNRNSTNADTYAFLQKQLDPIFAHSTQASELVIAYEPVWAIGTNRVPDNNYLETIFAWLWQTVTTTLPKTTITLLYGGSVTEHNAASLLTINYISGLLIGGASLDFQKFQNIVLLKEYAVSP